MSTKSPDTSCRPAPGVFMDSRTATALLDCCAFTWGFTALGSGALVTVGMG